MKCNKKNCPLVGNNENCDIRDCKWRTEDAGEVNAVKEYEDAIFQLEHNKISLGEYESLIEPLKHLYAVKPYTEKMMVNGEEIDIDPVSYEVGLTKGMMESQPKQGEWILNDIQRKEDTDNGNYQYTCSECGHGDIHARTQEVPYCWWCGAKMKGATDGNK